MALELDATVGGAAANTYCTLAEADAYHETHPHADAWTAATADEKKRVLVTATRLLDERMQWDGSVASATQALLWPRTGLVGANGYPLPSTMLPARLKQATAELARQLLERDPTANSDSAGIRRLAVAGMELEFDTTAAAAPVIADAAFAMVAVWGRERGRSSVVVSLERA